MRSYVWATALAAGLMGSTAQAADINPPSFDWSGFYVGMQGGFLTGGSDHVPWANVGVRPFNHDDGPAPMNGVLAGVHAELLQQSGQLVFGGIAEANYNSFVGDDDQRGGHTNGFEGKFSGSLRAKIGFTPADRTLIYATGGLAFLAGDGTVRIGPPTVPITERVGTSFTGWTVGAGLEQALSENVTANIEYRYTKYGQTAQTYVAGYDLAFEPHSHEVTLGISYKF